MKKDEVPQDHDLINAGMRKDVYYALDENGEFVQVLSTGWEAKNTVIMQAWEAVNENVEKALSEVKAGRRSPLYYHMVKAQMDIKLLSEYTGFSRTRVKHHCTPAGFRELVEEDYDTYARVLMITPEELKTLPDA
jgi:hypothetical protein